jgi:L-ascorbate metabolism protein UlaG (beta-lactamase superfamily)
MENYRFSGIKKIFLTIIINTMALTAFSQDIPAVDRLKTAAGVLELHFIGHGTLMFKLNDFVIHIDPVGSYGNYKNLPKADLILVTHEHSDHLDANLIGQLRKPGTVMLCSKSCVAEIPWAQPIANGETRIVSGITIEAIPAYNIRNMRAPGQPFHPRGTGNGYVLTIGDKRIYIAGDTENTPEMKALKNINVAFLPMNLPYTMTPEMVADAAKAFKPEILYPYHYSDTKAETLVNLLIGTDIEVRIRKLR